MVDWNTNTGLTAQLKGITPQLKLNRVEAETTKSNESDNFLQVAREADLSTGPT